MKKNHEILFTPFDIGQTTIQNRFVLCAMEGTNLVEGMTKYKFNEHCPDYYRERAKTGVGLIIPGMIPIRSFAGNQWLYESESVFMGPVKDLVEEIHAHGSKIFFQVGAGMGRAMVAVPILRKLYHGKFLKRFAKLFGMDVERVFAGASPDMPNVWDPTIKARALTKKEIKEIIDAFGKTAALCQRAGIDGIEIHAVHEGYLLDQFTMTCTNEREDEYGGSLENRMRFTTEIIKSIKAACGDDYPVSVRFSVESKMRGFQQGAVPGEVYEEFGRDKEEAIQAAKILEEAGCDLLNADNGTYDAWFWAHPPMYMPLACNLPEASFLKPHVSIPVACAGRMEDPDQAAEALAEGHIDAVGIARQFLCDGLYLDKIREEKIDDIRPCIACHNGCFGVYRYKGEPGNLPKTPLGRCALNPVTFQEEKYRLKQAEQKKKIAVIGGGIGGMEAARLMALQGHEVDLYEKSDELGGVFIAAAAPTFKEKDRMLLEWYKNEMGKLPISIHFEEEISPSMLDTLGADEIIVATGATPRVLPIPGIDLPHVIEAIEYLNQDKTTGQSVVVVGGGLTGCEIAYDLALQGKKVTIVEMLDDILKVKDLCAANSNMLRELIRYHAIDVELEAPLLSVTPEHVVIGTKDGEKTIPCDSVVLSVGYTPNALVSADSKQNIHLLGDCEQVGNLKDVIWSAYDLCVGL